MSTETNKQREDKNPSPELMGLINKFVDEAHIFFIDRSSEIDTLRSKYGMTDKAIRDSLISSGKISNRLIDALMTKDHDMFVEVWMIESWDKVIKQ